MDYKICDADSHFYEARDTFTRHGDEKVRKYVRWIKDGKRERLLIGDRMELGIPNPTFNPISKPGAWAKSLKEMEMGATAIGSSSYGAPGPTKPFKRGSFKNIALPSSTSSSAEVTTNILLSNLFFY